MQDNKLDEKPDKLKILDNCNAIMAPLLNDELIQRHVGKLDNVVKRENTKLHNVQSVLTKAAAGILSIMEKLHMLATIASLAVAENTKDKLTGIPCSTRPIKCWSLMVMSLPF